MHNVLLVYKQLSLQFDENGELLPFENDKVTHVLSYDEKPGIQAIANKVDDKMPNEDNEAIPLVSDTHTSDDYIRFLKILDEKYPEGDKIRLVLDNFKVHSSAKVQEYLNTIPERFEFVFTPKHASWLNLVEGFFSKMIKQMLRGIRINSKQKMYS